MTKTRLNKEWKNAIPPLAFWFMVLIVSVLFNRLGSKSAIPKTISLIASVYSLTFTIFYGIKMMLLRKKIKQLNAH